MQKFYTNEIAKLTQALTQLSSVMNLYNQRDFETDTALLQLLTSLENAYTQDKQPELETWIRSIKMEFVTCQRGVNPLTYEKLTTGKRDMQWTIYFRILQSVYAKISGLLEPHTERLRDARELITQIIIAGLQNGMITTTLLQSIQNEQDVEQLWQHLSTDANILLGQRRVLLLVSPYDVWILLADAVNALLRT